MTEKIKQTIFIYTIFAGANSFTYTITNVMFKPTHMIVKTVSFVSGTASNNLVVLSSDLSANRTLAVFAALSSSSINLKTNSYFPLNKDVNRTYTFNLSNANGNPLFFSGSIGIQIALIQHQLSSFDFWKSIKLKIFSTSAFTKKANIILNNF